MKREGEGKSKNPVKNFIDREVAWTREGGRLRTKYVAVVSAGSLDALWEQLRHLGVQTVAELFRSLVPKGDYVQSVAGRIVIEERKGEFRFSHDSEEVLASSLPIGLFEALCLRHVWEPHGRRPSLQNVGGD